MSDENNQELVLNTDLDSLRLTDAEKKILEFYIKTPEISKYALAKAVGYSYVTVWKAFKNPDFLGVITSVSKNNVHELALLASQVLRDILLKAPLSIKFNCAVSILKNVGALSDKQTNVQQQVLISWVKPEQVVETTVSSEDEIKDVASVPAPSL